MKINSKAAGGFTLLELLVVVAVITILAAMVYLAASRAKQRALAAQCRQNLQQLGIALQLFSAETSTYPLLINPDYRKGAYPEHYSGWQDAIQHELSKHGIRFGGKNPDPDRAPYPPEGIWHCPAAYLPSSFEPSEGYSDYGYNCYGISGPADTNSLGLGGHYVWRATQVTQLLPAPPVKESEVVSPSEMIAIGDGFWGFGNVIKDGTWCLRRSAGTEDYRGSTKRAYTRHLGKANVLFCDEHVEACGLKILFEDSSDMALSRWNRDHQPHRELRGP